MTRHYCEFGYLPKYCGAWLEGLSSTLPDPARVVEIGSASGCSLNAILTGLSKHDDCFVWTVDIRKLPHLRNEAVRMELPEDKWEMITGDSVDVAERWTEKLDMVYIDGDHSDVGCRRDIYAWEKHLKFGGLMVFDDYEQFMHHVTEVVDSIMFAEDSTWRYVGQVGRLIAFEKGTLTEQAPWLTDYMVKYDSNAYNRFTLEKDPWLWWGWGIPGKKHQVPPRPVRKFYGKSPKGHYVDKLP